MSDNGLDSAASSASNTADNADNDDFPIGNRDPEAGDDIEQPNDNVEVINQDNEVESLSYMDNTILLEFPKFSKDFKVSDFREFVRTYVGEENLEKLESYKYPNLWMMQVKSKEIREDVLRIWKTKIKNKTCWIKPYHDYELRGCLHWLPHFISDDDVKRQLSQFGDVLLLENQVHDYWRVGIKSEIKYFGLRLKDGMVKSDLPHFLKFDGYRTLVIVRGRKPACFHCREFGHTKKDCKTYKEKLNEYCKNPEARKPRTKPRGRRHRPDTDSKCDGKDKHQSEANSTSISTLPERKDSNLVKSCLNRTYSDGKLADDKRKAEILAILRSLKEWIGEIREMVEQTLKNIEENFKMNLTSTELLEPEEKEQYNELTREIYNLLDEMKQTTFEMIEQTLNNLKNVVARHFGLDSHETLEKLISAFEPRRKEKLAPKEVNLMENQLLSYTKC